MKVRKPKKQNRQQQQVRDTRKKTKNFFETLRMKIRRRRERLSLGGRARRIIGARKFERGAELAREKARRNRLK